jgi:primosomal protein N' (replication factor Y)
MANELGHLLSPAPENLKVLGPAEAPVPRVKKEFRYQLLIKAASRPVLKAELERIRAFALREKWKATALVIDVDPLTLL